MPRTPNTIPEPLLRLSALALDLHWSWNHAGDAIWKRLDATMWESTQNPWLLLQHVPFQRLERLAKDAKRAKAWKLEPQFVTVS